MVYKPLILLWFFVGNISTIELHPQKKFSLFYEGDRLPSSKLVSRQPVLSSSDEAPI